MITIEVGPHLLAAIIVVMWGVVILGWFRFKAGGRKIL